MAARRNFFPSKPEAKKPKLGKEKVWDVSTYRTEDIEELKNLGVQTQYLILPDQRNELVSSQHIHDMLQGPLWYDDGVAGITFYSFISTCNSNVFSLFSGFDAHNHVHHCREYHRESTRKPKFGIQSICHKEDILVYILFFFL